MLAGRGVQDVAGLGQRWSFADLLQAGITVLIKVRVQMPDRGNIRLGSALGLRLQRVHRDVDVGAVGILVAQVTFDPERGGLRGAQEPRELKTPRASKPHSIFENQIST